MSLQTQWRGGTLLIPGSLNMVSGATAMSARDSQGGVNVQSGTKRDHWDNHRAKVPTAPWLRA
jgi:hypothetical protein